MKGILTLMKKFLTKEEGMGTVEIIIILAILVALALVFRNFIMDLANSLFDSIEESAEGII